MILGSSLGSSHSGKCQKRYRHKKDWLIYRNGESIGSLITNEINSEEELRQVKEFLQMTCSDKAVLRWTATEHYDCENVVVTI